MIDDAFGNWLAGFIDGEGCFALSRKNNHYGCGPSWSTHFFLKVRDDEAPMIEEIHRRTGIGRVQRSHPPSAYRMTRPQVHWQVQSKAECLVLVELLERYPLRAKKARDFAIWAQAVRLKAQIISGGSGARAFNEPVWAQIALLYDQLTALRVYEMPIALVQEAA